MHALLASLLRRSGRLRSRDRPLAALFFRKMVARQRPSGNRNLAQRAL